LLVSRIHAGMAQDPEMVWPGVGFRLRSTDESGPQLSCLGRTQPGCGYLRWWGGESGVLSPAARGIVVVTLPEELRGDRGFRHGFRIAVSARGDIRMWPSATKPESAAGRLPTHWASSRLATVTRHPHRQALDLGYSNNNNSLHSRYSKGSSASERLPRAAR
jgi:hypothetical protein